MIVLYLLGVVAAMLVFVAVMAFYGWFLTRNDNKGDCGCV